MSDSQDKSSKKNWKPATRAVRGGLARSQHGEISEALYLTSGYAYDSAEQAAARMRGDEPGFVYSRYGSPTVEMLQQRLALIEGAETCRMTASGMGAISSAVIAPLQQGDRVVAAKALFGSCRWIITNLLPKYGVEVEFVDGADVQAKALGTEASAVYVEHPIQDRTDEEMQTIADKAIEEIISKLVAP